MIQKDLMITLHLEQEFLNEIKTRSELLAFHYHRNIKK